MRKSVRDHASRSAASSVQRKNQNSKSRVTSKPESRTEGRKSILKTSTNAKSAINLEANDSDGASDYTPPKMPKTYNRSALKLVGRIQSYLDAAAVP